MHELSIAAVVVESAEGVARVHGADAVAGVVPDALRCSFSLVAEGIALDRAELVVEEVSVRARCGDCDARFAVGSPAALWCPRCDTPAAELLTGRELELAEVRMAGSP
ncbi:hydrogenase maturation nickel metallochaperone HypA/HybF [Streptomyces acidicola]|uniref:Hydrogenase maturation nickel metallochaperone HypA n=1 Tax=Streptomyces acidicola TaxID=2596892 RepID=A0A5N8WWL1_9ACTN|nr:hydrogenase maturation nickel metallochaperone HypA [Streptomyces acidicola]MPY50585.1 hydrogenase maturation nickel metallochaperone HypA [Streptomyces acidicola]